MGRERLAASKANERDVYRWDDEWEGHWRIVSDGEGQMNEIDCLFRVS
jgi:hypothetical protein